MSSSFFNAEISPLGASSAFYGTSEFNLLIILGREKLLDSTLAGPLPSNNLVLTGYESYPLRSYKLMVELPPTNSELLSFCEFWFSF
jgi:hypothetical protein